METAANRMALVDFAVAVAKHLEPALDRPMTAHPSRTHRTNVVQTTPRFLRRWHSRLKSRSQSQLSLDSIILLTQTKRTRATRRLTSSGSRIYDIPCTLMMLTRLAVGLEPLNALDAAHRSPRSVSGIGSPVDPALAGPLSEQRTEKLSDFRPNESSRARYYVVDLGLHYI